MDDSAGGGKALVGHKSSNGRGTATIGQEIKRLFKRL
jgi:hypothetical protein